jgi:hypothetical protein
MVTLTRDNIYYVHHIDKMHKMEGFVTVRVSHSACFMSELGTEYLFDLVLGAYIKPYATNVILVSVECKICSSN